MVLIQHLTGQVETIREKCLEIEARENSLQIAHRNILKILTEGRKRINEVGIQREQKKLTLRELSL